MNIDDRKDSIVKLRDVRFIMLMVNFIAIFFVTGIVEVTTNNICREYSARDFLDSLYSFPVNPMNNFKICIFLCFLLLTSFVIREWSYNDDLRIVYGTLVMDFILSFMVILVTNFNYNGILFYAFANVIAHLRGNKSKYFMISLALVSFLITDSGLLSMKYNLYELEDYFAYYDLSMQQKLIGFHNVLGTVNIILFLIYCIQLIQQQKGTIDEINMLNEEIKKTNMDLHNANRQLEEYAKITEHLGETKERNRLAREIHDTLGHTLTGISCGIDACIATVETAPSATKEHLERISEVARNGLLEIRRSVSELKPDALERLCLETAITKMITDMKSVANIQIYFDCKISPLKFDEDEEGAIYRVIQESLTNAIRHGKATKVSIVMERNDGKVFLTIQDNGVGCKEIKSGFGTRHIMERIEMLNGNVEFSGENGFCVKATIPIRWGEEYD